MLMLQASDERLELEVCNQRAAVALYLVMLGYASQQQSWEMQQLELRMLRAQQEIIETGCLADTSLRMLTPAQGISTLSVGSLHITTERHCCEDD